MKKNLKKIALLSIGIVSAVSLCVSVPIILYRNFSPFYFSKNKNVEITNFEKSTSDLNKQNIEKIKKVLESKKKENINEVFYAGDYPNIEEDSLSSYVQAAEKMNLNDKYFDNFRSSIVEISLSEEFYNKLHISDVYRYLYIFKYFKIEANWQKIENILDKNYLKDKGVFTFSGTYSEVDIPFSKILFQPLFKYFPKLFKKYYKPEKIIEIFKNYNFSYPNNKDNIQYGRGLAALNFVSYLDDKTKNELFKAKNLTNWISSWDNVLAKEKNEDESEGISRRLFFSWSIKNDAKGFYSFLKSEENLGTEIARLINNEKLNLHKSTYTNIILRTNKDFLIKNNVFEKLKNKFISTITNQLSTYQISLKNSALSYVLSANLGDTQNNKKILYHLNDRLKILENSISSSEFINDEGMQIYYLTLLSTTYFRSELFDFKKLKEVIKFKLKNEISIVNIWYLTRALLLLNTDKEKISISSSVYQKIKNILNSLSRYNKNLIFVQMLYWFDLSEIYNLKIFNRDFFLNIVNVLKNNSIGFKQTSFSTDFSMSSTFLIMNLTKMYFKNDKELYDLVKNNTVNLLEHVKNNDLKDFTKIEDFYNYFALQELVKD